MFEVDIVKRFYFRNPNCLIKEEFFGYFKSKMLTLYCMKNQN